MQGFIEVIKAKTQASTNSALVFTRITKTNAIPGLLTLEQSGTQLHSALNCISLPGSFSYCSNLEIKSINSTLYNLPSQLVSACVSGVRTYPVPWSPPAAEPEQPL